MGEGEGEDDSAPPISSFLLLAFCEIVWDGGEVGEEEEEWVGEGENGFIGHQAGAPPPPAAPSPFAIGFECGFEYG